MHAGLAALIAMLVGALAVVAEPRALAHATAQGQTAAADGMSNRDVIMMVDAGLAEDVIITAIRQAPRRGFDLTPTGLIELKLAHVPDPIVRAMQSAEGDRPASRPPSVSAPMTTNSTSSIAAPSASSDATATGALAEPSVAGEMFGVVASTGALKPLERVRMNTRKVGNARSQGTFKGSVQDYAYYFDGGSSPVTFAAGEPLRFVIRMMGPVSRSGREATPEEAQKHFLLTRLEAEGGVRYITKTDVQFDVRSYGRPRAGLDSRRPAREAGSFVLTPRTVLAPGQYVILMAGTSNFEFIGDYNSGADRWAFAIVGRP